MRFAQLLSAFYTGGFYHGKYTDASLIAKLPEDLGEAMVGINEQEIQLIMAERGIQR